MNRIVCACFSFQFVLFGCCSRWSNGSEASFNKSTPATEPKIHTRRQRERANESLKHFYNKWVVYFCVPCSKIPICRGEKESRYVERGSLYFMFTGNGHRQKTRFRSFVRSFFFVHSSLVRFVSVVSLGWGWYTLFSTHQQWVYIHLKCLYVLHMNGIYHYTFGSKLKLYFWCIHKMKIRQQASTSMSIQCGYNGCGKYFNF